LRPGEWLRNERALMEAELPGRVSEEALELLPATLPPNWLPLPIDVTEPRRIMRLVWRLPIGSGVAFAERRAAAAAAEDSEAVDGRL
jgi:hypothetical protein